MIANTYKFTNLSEKKLNKGLRELENEEAANEALNTIKNIAENTAPRPIDQRGQIIGLLAQEGLTCNVYNFSKSMPLIEIKPNGERSEDRIFILAKDNTIEVVGIGKGSHK